MRFKAKLALEQVSLLHSLLTPLSKLVGDSQLRNNAAVLILDSHYVRISVKGSHADSDGITAFAELRAKDGIFVEHRIESIAENNLILMELDLTQLKNALQSLMGNGNPQRLSTTPPNAVIKLARRQNMACLCIEGSQANFQLHHTIPIRILRPTEVSHYLPPNMEAPSHIAIASDRHKSLKPLLDRLKVMATTAQLEASSQGDLTIYVDTQHGASIQTYLAPSQNRGGASNEVYKVKVDTKKLAISLPSSLQWTTNLFLTLIPDQALIWHADLVQQIGAVTYYVPVHLYSSSS